MTTPKPALRPGRDLRRALLFAGLMLASPFAAKLGAALGWFEARDAGQRGLMILVGAFIALVGNEMPKRLSPLASLRSDAARVQAFQRFMGWTWALIGLSVALAWIALPLALAQTATFVIVPAGIGLTLYRLLRCTLRSAAA